MKLRTQHRKVIIGDTQYEFTPFQDYFVGEVPDEVGNLLCSLKRHPNEYRIIQEEDKVAEVKPDVKPAVVKDNKKK